MYISHVRYAMQVTESCSAEAGRPAAVAREGYISTASTSAVDTTP